MSTYSKYFLSIFIFLTFLIPSTVYAFDDVNDLGSLDHDSQSLLGIWRLGYKPSPTTNLKEHQALMGIQLTESNFWLAARFPYSPTEGLLIDAELTEATFNFRVGISDSVETAVYIRLITIHGGFLDTYIESFHHTFGFFNAYREYYPRNNVVIADTRYGRADFKPQTTLNDIIIENKFSLIPDTLQLIKQVRIPVNSIVGGSGILLAFQSNFRFEDFSTQIALGFTWHEDKKFFFYDTHNFVSFAHVSLKFRLEKWCAIIFAWQGQTPYGEGSETYYYNEFVSETYLGAQFLIDDTIIQFSIIENIKQTTSGDIGFHFSVAIHGAN